MNKCDLEETKKLIEQLVLDAVADEDGWQSVFYGEAFEYTKGSHLFHAERGTGGNWHVSLKNTMVKTFSRDDKPFFERLRQEVRDDLECQRLLKLLNPVVEEEPAPTRLPWWRFW